MWNREQQSNSPMSVLNTDHQLTLPYPKGEGDNPVELEGSPLMYALSKRSSLTPDFKELKKKKGHTVFIANNFKSSKKGYGLIKDKSYYLGKAITVGSDYQLYWSNGFSVPIRRQNENLFNNCHPMYGELYYVPLNTLCLLDKVHHNGKIHDRSQVYIWCQDQKVKDNSGFTVNGKLSSQVWMYLGNWSYWSERSKLTLESCTYRIEGKSVLKS